MTPHPHCLILLATFAYSALPYGAQAVHSHMRLRLSSRHSSRDLDPAVDEDIKQTLRGMRNSDESVAMSSCEKLRSIYQLSQEEFKNVMGNPRQDAALAAGADIQIME